MLCHDACALPALSPVGFDSDAEIQVHRRIDANWTDQCMQQRTDLAHTLDEQRKLMCQTNKRLQALRDRVIAKANLR